MIYEPEEDSELLAKWVKKIVKGKVLDMGTGSGIQALAAQENGCEVLAVDINPEAVSLVSSKGIETVQSDLFDNVQEKFDWIIFNPPYLPENPQEPEESKLITTGGVKGDELLNEFLAHANDFLLPNGQIMVVISSLTGDPKELFKNYNYVEVDKESIFFETLTVYVLTQKM
jgi:release factor glutamine methyltransferase